MMARASSSSTRCKVKSLWMGLVQDVVAPAKRLKWVVRAGNVVAVVVAVTVTASEIAVVFVEMLVDSAFVVVGTCVRTKGRVDASSEAAGEPSL